MPSPASDIFRITLPSPATTEEFKALERIKVDGINNVCRFAPGIIVKFGCDKDAEVRVLEFIHGLLSPWNRLGGVWYFFMDECPGVPLDTVIDHLPSTELDHIADQLLVVLNEMRSYLSKTIGSITGGPYNNRFMPFPWHPPHAFQSTEEYLDHYRGMFLEFCGPKYVEELFGCFPTDAQVYFTHGDLLPHNILVDASKITTIIDWETAGYYPEFWEYCRMHDLGLMTPAWGHVLARIFPGPRREKEIRAVYKILRDLHHNSAYLA